MIAIIVCIVSLTIVVSSIAQTATDGRNFTLSDTLTIGAAPAFSPNDCSNFPAVFKDFVDKSIVKQAQRLNIGPCADPAVRKFHVGMNPNHWEIIHIIDFMQMAAAGSAFPTGIFFSPLIHSLPVPTGSARDFFVQRTRRVRLVGLLGEVDLCTTVGQVALVAALAGDYNAFAPSSVTGYLQQNCHQIQQVMVNRTIFQNMYQQAVFGIERVRPALLSFTFGDEAMLDAVIRVTVAFFYNSEGGFFVFV